MHCFRLPGVHNREVRPVSTQKDPLIVLVNVWLTSLGSVSEKDQTMTTTMLINIGYVNHKLKWNSSDYNVFETFFSYEEVYVPTVLVLNSRAGMTKSVGNKHTQMYVNSCGYVV